MPRLTQWVARAPGYTMTVDGFSGVGTYLLDADGHRRFGKLCHAQLHSRLRSGAARRPWIFRAQQACHQVWNSSDSLTILGESERLQHEFHEDRVVIRFLDPSHADREQTMWLANFDTLEAPIHNGTQEAPTSRS